jgi:hypothetical protein
MPERELYAVCDYCHKPFSGLMKWDDESDGFQRIDWDSPLAKKIWKHHKKFSGEGWHQMHYLFLNKEDYKRRYEESRVGFLVVSMASFPIGSINIDDK